VTLRYGLISADSHVNEAPDTFEARLPAAWRERGPRIVTLDDGRDAWVGEGFAPRPLQFGVHAAGRRNDGEAYTTTRLDISRDEMVKGSYDPRARLVDMDRDGLDAEVLYPGPLGGLGTGGAIANIADTPLRHACFRAYHDWLAEYCGAAPDRFAGLALARIEEPDFGVAELQRAASIGLRGAVVNAMPDLLGSPPLFSHSYDRFWSAADETGLPLSLHIYNARCVAPLAGAASREAAALGDEELARRSANVMEHVGSGSGLFETYMTMMCMDMAEPVQLIVFSGLLDRFPNLRFVIAEAGVGWIPFMIERMEYVFDRHRVWMRSSIDRRPAEYFHDHFFATFQQDDYAGLLARHVTGVGNLMWASDYPHTDTTWPFSHDVVDREFGAADIPDDERRAITVDNCAQLYRLPV